MGPFLCGFADELIKLGRALSPAEGQLRVKQQAAFKPPAPTVPTSPTGPIRKTAPTASSFGPTKVPQQPMKLMDPYGPKTYGQGERKGFEFSRPKSTAPARGTARSLRPSNAAGPSPGALTAIPRQEMRSPPKERERSTYRPSPGYLARSTAKAPAPKPKKRRGSGRGVTRKVKDPGVAWESTGERTKRLTVEKKSRDAFAKRKGDRLRAAENKKFETAYQKNPSSHDPTAEEPRFKSDAAYKAWKAQQAYNMRRNAAKSRAAKAKYARGKQFTDWRQ